MRDENSDGWYSIATPQGNNISINDIDGEDKVLQGSANHNALTFEKGICEFCLKDHKRYSELLNNVCQTCGKTASFITNVNNTQMPEKVTALNERLPLGDEGEMAEMFGSVSMELDYGEMINPMEKDNHIFSHNNSEEIAYNASDAIARLNQMEKQNSKIYHSEYNANVKFRLKTFK